MYDPSPKLVAPMALDLAALASAQQELFRGLEASPHVSVREKAAAAAEKASLAEQHRLAELSPEERAARAERQEAHAAKIRKHRAESEAREAAAAAKQRERARNMPPSRMGIGLVPVDVGDTVDAYEYEVHFESARFRRHWPARAY